MGSLDDVYELNEARVVVLATAREHGLEAALAMLQEALVQLEEIAPALSGEVWEAFSAVVDAAPRRGACIAATVVPLKGRDQL